MPNQVSYTIITMAKPRASKWGKPKTEDNVKHFFLNKILQRWIRYI